VTSAGSNLPSGVLRSQISFINRIATKTARVRRFVRLTAAMLAAAIFQAAKVATLRLVSPGTCLYALDPTAAITFQIAGAQSVYTECRMVSESSWSRVFQMKGRKTSTSKVTRRQAARACTS
jgi:hypothetical protein